MSSKEVEFVVFLIPALKQKSITRRGNRKRSASFDWRFKHKILFEVCPHQPEFIVIIKPQIFFFVQTILQTSVQPPLQQFQHCGSRLGKLCRDLLQYILVGFTACQE